MVDGFEPDAVLALLRRPEAPSHVSLVPVQLARLLEAASTPAPGDAPLVASAPAALRAVLLGGAAIPPDLMRRATAAGWPVIATYGLTEAGSGVTALSIGDATASPGCAGRPLPGVMVRITGPSPDGVGEIEVRTPAAFSGYLGRPEATRAAFTADGWLRTGDLGHLDAEARLVVADRREDLVISGGENVYPAEVEAALASHPAIGDVGVAGRTDPTWGAVPVAGIVLRPGVPDPDDQALRAWCRERLAPFKVPASFLRLTALPRTSTGKLRRRELRETLTPLVVLLHATLSTGRQLAPLARALGAPGDLRLVAPDRLGSGTRRLDPPREVGVAEHGRTSARSSTRRASSAPSSWATASAASSPSKPPRASRTGWRPSLPTSRPTPLSPSSPTSRSSPARPGTRSSATAGRARAVPRARRQARHMGRDVRAGAGLPRRRGWGAVADAAMAGLDADGLARIGCPVTILTGSASVPF